MMHPLLTSELARERQERYRADAGRSRLARPAANPSGRVVRAGRSRLGRPDRDPAGRPARAGRTDPDRAA